MHDHPVEGRQDTGCGRRFLSPLGMDGVIHHFWGGCHRQPLGFAGVAQLLQIVSRGADE